MNVKFLYAIPVLIYLLLSCDTEPDTPISKGSIQAVNDENRHLFDEYWYAGEAEVNSYALQQARYGEMRNGDAVLVFVTEPFSVSKQVKLDYPDQAGKDRIPVLKMNAIRKFNTGIYAYSMMNSVFTPVNVEKYTHSLKSTTTSQEWCGHSFTQFNLEGKEYHVQQFSYFESEGDEEKDIDAVLMEDELLNYLRLHEGKLPDGNVDLIPSSIYTRLNHENIRPTKVNISKTHSEGSTHYLIEYLHYNRTVTIQVEQNFPYKIMEWTENNGDGLTTSARLQKTLKIDYWAKNSNQNESLRAELGLN